VIKLFQPPASLGAANPSPFCIKLEVLLKMSELPFEIKIEGDPRKGPTGKIPFIKDNNKALGDSGLIQQYLEREYNIDFNAGLTDRQKADGLAYTRLAEEHLYWALVYSRWLEDENWEKLKPLFFGNLPFPLKLIVPNIARKGLRKALHGHGIGRHDRDELYALAADDLAAIAVFLDGNDFAFGDQPKAVDAAIYGQLSSIIDAPFDTPLKRAALSHDILSAYCTRMRARFFPELD
jgi:glutathione S-transferase